MRSSHGYSSLKMAQSNVKVSNLTDHDRNGDNVNRATADSVLLMFICTSGDLAADHASPGAFPSIRIVAEPCIPYVLTCHHYLQLASYPSH